MRSDGEEAEELSLQRMKTTRSSGKPSKKSDLAVVLRELLSFFLCSVIIVMCSLPYLLLLRQILLIFQALCEPLRVRCGLFGNFSGRVWERVCKWFWLFLFISVVIKDETNALGTNLYTRGMRETK